MMFVIAVTGGIGSGKSTVSELFKAKGIPAIDTDVIARQLVNPGQPLLQRISQTFGQEYLDAQGHLDRRAMRNLIFNDSGARNKLESMMHPAIHMEVEKTLSNTHAPYCLIHIPLLVTSQQTYDYDRVLLVDAPEATRIQRTVERDKISPEQVKQIIHSQSSRTDMLAIADDVLDNGGDSQALAKSVSKLHQKYLSLASSKA